MSDEELTAVAASFPSVLERNRQNHGQSDSEDVEQEDLVTAPQHINQHRDNPWSKLSSSSTKMTKRFTFVFIIITVILGLIQFTIVDRLRGLQGNLKDCNLHNQNFTLEIQNLHEQLRSQNNEIEKLNLKLINKNSQMNQLNSQIIELNAKINASSRHLELQNFNEKANNNYAQVQICVGYVTSKLWSLPSGFVQRVWQPQIGEHSVISIDLGSKYSHTAIYFAGKVQRIPHFDQSGEIFDATASYVDLDNNFEGQSAQKVVESTLNSSTSIFYDLVSLLRHETFAENNGSRLNSKINLGFQPLEGAQGTFASHNNIEYSVATVLSKLFRKLRKNSSKFFDFPISKCVIAHTFFQKTKILHKALVSQAAEMAGFKEVSFLEPSIAAVTALVHPIDSLNIPKNILYINLGARYWEFSVVEVDKGRYVELDGGIIYDSGYLQNDILNYILTQFSLKHNISEANLKSINQIWRLHEASEKAMISLSTKENTLIHVNEFYNGMNLTANISRSKFLELTSRHFKAIDKYSREVLNSTGIYIENIDNVVLVGGCSKILKANEVVRNIFGEKIVDLNGIEPEQVVAFGAAVKGAILAAEII